MSDEDQQSNLPRCIECWRTKSEKQEKETGERQKWLNRPTFILASIGAAVGLGNFWRFPYLTEKYGGGFFFIPYLLALFTMGIPLLLMELSLGQKFQKGDVAVFGGINKRLRGIGVASVFSAYIITFYYNVIISWALIYLVASFMSPLPWSSTNPDFVWKCDKTKMTPAQQFFEIDVIRFKNDNCEDFKDGDPTLFSWTAFGATLTVWLLCFLAVFKGVHGSSYIVWISVPMPLIFIVIMLIKNLQLPGAGQGVHQYLNGDGQEIPDTVWADAVGQIFFSIGVCMGIMTSYGSYNPIKKPIILDNMIICCTNSSVSFISGFAVWAIVGYLQSQNSLARTETSSAGLAFIAFPTACDLMSWSNLWSIMFSATLFLLGIDSAFSMVEATSTVITDFDVMKNIPRGFISFIICFAGFLFSLPFCTNWGFVLFDIIDHYLCTYLLFLCGIFQCFGCGWAFDVEPTMNQSENHRQSLMYLTLSYWIYIMVVGVIFVILEMVQYGIIALAAGIVLFCLLPSFMISKMSFRRWLFEIAFCGVRKLAYSMSKLSRPDPRTVRCWEPIFVFYWCFMIKYFVPCVLWVLIFNNVVRDLERPYQGHAAHWQAIGLVVPLLGLISFLLNICFCLHDEPLDMAEFKERFDKDFDDPWEDPFNEPMMDKLKVQEEIFRTSDINNESIED